MTWLNLKTITLLITAAFFLAGGTFGLFLRSLNNRLRARLALGCAFGGSLVAFFGAAAFLLRWQHFAMKKGETIISLILRLPNGFPAFSLNLFIDRLSAFFLLLTGLLSAGVALYSFTWLKDKYDQHRIAGIYNYFVLFTLLLLVVNDVYFFLLLLECMTLAFSYLTLYRHNTLLNKENFDSHEMAAAKLAFKTYLIFSHMGIIFIATAFILLALFAQDFSFDALRKLNLETKPVLASTIFLLALTGFGIKGGFAGAHPWVSIVHPYSPTTTHALTLGLIIKVSSFYMLIRVLFEFLSPVAWWWGWLLLLLAGMTAVVGVFYAITSRDLKTALSNHSVENIGIILAGLGLALLYSPKGLVPSLAVLALVAALYHLLNHTVFKGLLYLCTGAIENRTGTVNLEELGGLIRRFPWTSATFLIGAVAIAGFPPLNGFISEWLILQAIFVSLNLFASSSSPALLLAGLFASLLMLGAAFGLTALAFVKIAGETLLGAPRRPELLDTETKGEVPWKMRTVLVALAVFCLLLGLFPGLVVNELAGIAQEILLLEPPYEFMGTTPTSLNLKIAITDKDSYAAQLFMLPLLVLAVLPLTLAVLLSARRKLPTRGPIWTCGTLYYPETMQITGGAFAFLAWEWAGEKVSAPVSSSELNEPAAADRFLWRLPLSMTRYVREDFRRGINGIINKLLAASWRIGEWFQGGDIRAYLGYLFIAFILALIIAVLR